MAEKFEKFSERARRVMTLAEEEARRLNQSHVDTEHLLLAIISESDLRPRGIAINVLVNLGVDLDKLRAEIESKAEKGKQPVKGEIELSPAAKRAFELAADEARQFEHHHVGTEHLVLGLLRGAEGLAATALESFGATLERVDAELERLLSGVAPTEEEGERLVVPTMPTRQPAAPTAPAARAKVKVQPKAAPVMLQTDKQLTAIMEQIRSHLDAKHGARERGLAFSRDALRHSANAIRAVHRGEFAQAERLLHQARSLLEQASEALADHPDVYHAGFVHNAQKEFAEGSLTLSLVAGRPLPLPQDLGMDVAPYLNGLGEAVGEMRRYLLDSLRSGDISHCEGVLEVMDDIYRSLATMDYPEAVTGGLRRTTDAVRGILERTRGDLTVALVQRNLERRLEEFEGKLPKA